MGRRSRKTRPAAGAAAAPPTSPGERAPASSDALRRGHARGEERDRMVREGLEPLAPGERPGAVTVAAVLAAALAVLNIGLYAAGVRAPGATFVGVVGVGVILLVAAAGMWRAHYWAVLGFEALLALTCIYASLSLLFASTASGAVRAVLIATLSGALFWKLIRAMARLQMPRRSPANRTR